MELIDPTVPGSQHDNARAPRLESLEGKTIGVLSNGKLNADGLLDATADLFHKRFGGTVLKRVYKSNPSAPAPTETLTNLAHEADYIITAAGD